MNDITCEATFEIDATPEEAWRALEEIRIERADPDKPGEWWFPGFECRTVEIDRDEGRRLTVRKAEEPCIDTVIDVTFEHTGTGSTIRITQSGFDQAFVDMAGEAFWAHAENIFADFQVFLVTGVVAGRAWRPWTPLGLMVTTLDHGVCVDDVFGGSWAERVGLRSGDLLCTVHGAPIYSSRDLGVIERVAGPGDEVAAAWVRDRDRLEASASL